MHILLSSMIYSYLITLSTFYIISNIVLYYPIPYKSLFVWFIILLNYECVCVFFKWEVVCVCECRCLVRPEESVISPGGGVPSSYDPSAVGAGIWILGLCKGSQHKFLTIESYCHQISATFFAICCLYNNCVVIY